MAAFNLQNNPQFQSSPKSALRPRLAGVPRVYVAIALAVVFVDQLGKYLALRFVSYHLNHIVGPFYIANLYDKRSSLFGQAATMPIFTLGFIFALAVATTMLVASRRALPKLAGALIFGGALSNFASMVFDAKGVPNFLCYNLWYFCNAADVTIFTGVVLAAVHTLRPSTLHALSAAATRRAASLWPFKTVHKTEPASAFYE